MPEANLTPSRAASTPGAARRPPRVSRAVASLLAASVVAIAVLGALVIWHLVRRGRLIREGLNPPRPVRWPDVETDRRTSRARTLSRRRPNDASPIP